MSSSGNADWAGDRGERWRRQLDGLEPTLAPVDEPLIDALSLDAPLRIADVGCGGGATSRAILQRAPRGSVVHGYDISPLLVDVARARAPAGEPLQFRVADMAEEPPADPAYDRLASRFGVMFFEDEPRAFDNLARWLRPGGRFAFAVWAPVSDNRWMSTVRDVVAGVVEVPKTDPDAPGPFRYGDAAKLVGLLERAGLSEVAVRDWRGALPVGGRRSPDEAATFALEAFSTFAELLASAGDAALREARAELTRRFSAHLEHEEVRLAARVHIVTGARG
jgi:SAM-dependent methyltransferase